MNTQQLRKSRERFFLDRLLAAAAMPASITNAGEAPDFAICLDGRDIGVEVTEIFTDQPNQQRLKAQESLSRRVVASARKRYEAAGGAHLHTSISFSPNIDLELTHRESVAEAVAQQLLSTSLSRGQHACWRNDFTNPTLTPITCINALGVSQAEFAHWTATAGGLVVTLPPKSVLHS